MADVVLGGVVELSGEASVSIKFAKVHRAAKKAKEGFNAADMASGKLSRGLKALARVAARIIRPLTKVFSIAKRIGALSLGGLVAGGAAVGILGIRDFGRFSLDIAKIGTLLPPTTNAMQKFGGAVREAAIAFGTDTTKSAESFFDALSAGIDPTRLKEFNQIIGEASVGGFTSQATAIKGVTSIMDSYGLSVDQAREVSDAFFVANEKGKTTFEKLASAVGKAAPMARAVGLSFKEFMSAVATGTKTLETSETVSGLKAMFTNIIKPSKEAKDLISELFDTKEPEKFFSVAALKGKGFINFLKEMKEKTGGDVTALNTLFGSSEALGAVLGLTSDVGIKSFTEGLAKMETQSGQTKDAFTRVSETVGFKLKQIGSGLKDLRLSVGEGLAEGFGLAEISNIPGFFKEQSKGVAEGASAFAKAFLTTLDPAFKLGKIDFKGIGKSMGVMAGTIAKGIGKLVGGIGKLVDGLGGLRAVIEQVNLLLGGDTPAERESARLRKEGGFRGGGVELVGKTRQAFIKGLGPGAQPQNFRDILKARRARANVAASLRKAGGGAAADAIDPTKGAGFDAFAATLSAKENKLLARFDKTMDIARGNAARALAKVQRRLNVAASATADIKADATKASKILKDVTARATDARKELAIISKNFRKNLSFQINLNQNLVTNINGKKKKKRSGSRVARFERGTGDATLPTTFENMFLIFDDDGNLLDVPDEFIIIPDAPESGEDRTDQETLDPGRRTG